MDVSALTASAAAQKEWADSLSKAVNFSALHDYAIVSSEALAAFSGANQVLTEALKQRLDVMARMTEGIAFKFPDIDFARWGELLDRWIPSNLRRVEHLDVVAAVRA